MRRAALILMATGLALTSCASHELDLGDGEDPVRYLARIDASTLGDPPPADALSGIWILSLAGDRYRLEQESFRIEEDVALKDDELVVSGVPAPDGAFNCYVNGERTLERTEGRYRVDADDDDLRLTLVRDPCPLRANILARTWRKSRS